MKRLDGLRNYIVEVGLASNQEFADQGAMRCHDTYTLCFDDEARQK